MVWPHKDGPWVSMCKAAPMLKYALVGKAGYDLHRRHECGDDMACKGQVDAELLVDAFFIYHAQHSFGNGGPVDQPFDGMGESPGDIKNKNSETYFDPTPQIPGSPGDHRPAVSGGSEWPTGCLG